MIEYDYLIERNEGNETVPYKPDKIPTKLPNLVRIEGPNSSGKSTLLNILALAFHGHELDKMNSSLKAKMRSLVDSGHQNIKFDIKISGRDGQLTLSSKKESLRGPEIVIKEHTGGKSSTLIQEQFHRKYHLIYDIPDDPTGRLDQLILEIKDVQRVYGIRVGALRNYLLQTLEQIKSSRDPGRIEFLKKAIVEQGKTLVLKKQQYESSKALLDELETYACSRILADKLSQKENASTRLKEFQQELEKAEKSVRKIDAKYNKRREEIRETIDEIRTLHRQIASTMRPIVPKDEKQHLSIWESINFDYVLRECEFNPSFKREISAIGRIMEGLLGGDTKQKMLEVQMFSELVELLKRYGSTSIILPGVDKTINDFVAILEEKNQENRKHKEVLDAVKSVIAKLDEIESLRAEVELAFVDLKGLRGKYNGEDVEYGEKDGLREQHSEMKAILNELTEACTFYSAECAKKGVTEDNLRKKILEMERSEAMKPFLNYSDKSLEGALESWRDNVSKFDKAASSAKTSLDFNKMELERLDKRERHKYQDYQELLGELHRRCQILEQRLTRQFEGYINSVSGKSGAVSRSGEESRYFNAVSRFLGSKLDHIRHLEKRYKVVKVDLLSKTILTEEGKVIHFSDMGTGQGQAAYLLGLLNVTDNRKIIALFDEVAMMDSTSMQPILDRLKELHQKDQLVVGIVVQRADSMNVVPMV